METWTDLCRCCLSANSEVSIIDSENNVKQKFLDITTIEVKTDDGLPQKLCDDCYSILNTSHQFRKQCIKMDTELKLQLNSFITQSSEINLGKLQNSIEDQENQDVEFANNPMKQLEAIIKKEPMDSDDDTYYVLVIDNPKDKENIEEIKAKANEDSPQVVKCEVVEKSELELFKKETNIDINVGENDNEIYESNDEQNNEFENTIDTFILPTPQVPATILESEEYQEENYQDQIEDSNIDSQDSIPQDDEQMEDDHNDIIQQIGNDQTLIKILTTSTDDEQKMTMLLKSSDGIQYLTEGPLITNDDDDESQEVILCEGDESQFQILKYDGSELVIEYADEGQIDQILQNQHSNILVCDCGEQFSDIAEFEKHQVKHNPGGEHLCTMCGKGFESVEILTGHMVLHNVAGLQLQCPFCNLVMKRSTLTQHIKSTHNNMKPQCEICLKTFANPNNLKRHLMIHTGVKEFECDICFKRFHQKITMQTHRLTHMNPLTCSSCDFEFKTKEELTDHKENDECPQSKTNNTQAKEEIMKTVKKEVTTSLGKLLGYACSLCKKMFSIESALERHIETSHIIDPSELLCSECGEVLGSKKEMQNHILTHDKRKNIKRFECSICGKGCPSQAMLIMHERVHTNERPFGCQLCPLKFKTKTHLRTHQLTHTREKKFGCSVCMKFFALKGNLVVHLRTHTGERPYVCSICGEAFIDSKYLKKHKLKKHSIGNVPWNQYLN